MGLFLTLFYLFIRVLPMIAIFEMRTLVPEAKLKAERHGKTMADDRPLYGLMAEFDQADGAGGCRRPSARAAGYRR